MIRCFTVSLVLFFSSWSFAQDDSHTLKEIPKDLAEQLGGELSHARAGNDHSGFDLAEVTRHVPAFSFTYGAGHGFAEQTELYKIDLVYGLQNLASSYLFPIHNEEALVVFGGRFDDTLYVESEPNPTLPANIWERVQAKIYLDHHLSPAEGRIGLQYFEMDYYNGLQDIFGPEKAKGTKYGHQKLETEYGLGVKAAMLFRDYEFEHHEVLEEGRGEIATQLASKDGHNKDKKNGFDTLHVVGLLSSSLNRTEIEDLDAAIPTTEYPGFYGNSDRAAGLRLSVLDIAKRNSTFKTNHKLLKGPFHNDKSIPMIVGDEEEWGSGTQSFDEAVVYKDPVMFLDLSHLREQDSGVLTTPEEVIYVVFFADDSGKTKFGKDFLYDKDDIVGVAKFPIQEVANNAAQGKRFAYVQADHWEYPGIAYLDLVVIFEIGGNQ